MTRDEVLRRLREERAIFDSKVAAVPREALEVPAAGSGRSPKDVVVHVTAYERLIVERLRAARRGESTAFDRDRDSWESFNDRIWSEAAGLDAATALADSVEVFAALLDEIGSLSDEELSGAAGVAAAIDPAWLDGRPMWELVGIDAFDHYPMHYPGLEAAARR
ncbi:MAG TPA: ClbS/DfsB family four-helix bundle protein [Coriobacteriia bacterium]